MEVSLYALSNSLKRKTISLQGFLNGIIVNILVVTGSSHSFINPMIVEQLGLTVEMTGPLVATLANGNTIISHALYRGVQWWLQEHDFMLDLRIMKIDGWDLILGVD